MHMFRVDLVLAEMAANLEVLCGRWLVFVRKHLISLHELPNLIIFIINVCQPLYTWRHVATNRPIHSILIFKVSC
jgi:hypothetical protein